jgi:hypothetical protein
LKRPVNLTGFPKKNTMKQKDGQVLVLKRGILPVKMPIEGYPTDGRQGREYSAG